jgi:hypothetical protein
MECPTCKSLKSFLEQNTSVENVPDFFSFDDKFLILPRTAPRQIGERLETDLRLQQLEEPLDKRIIFSDSFRHLSNFLLGEEVPRFWNMHQQRCPSAITSVPVFHLDTGTKS